nr:cAMP-binding protein [uncultured bacterium]
MSDADKYGQYADRIAIFKGLTADEVAQVIKQGQTLHFRQNQTIFHEGMLGSNLFIVLGGEVGIYRKTELIARCKTGDAFGEMAVLNHRPRTATATALSEAKCLTLDERQVNQILARGVSTKLLLNIIAMLSKRLENANAWISEAIRKNKLEGGFPE